MLNPAPSPIQWVESTCLPLAHLHAVLLRLLPHAAQHLHHARRLAGARHAADVQHARAVAACTAQYGTYSDWNGKEPRGACVNMHDLWTTTSPRPAASAGVPTGSPCSLPTPFLPSVSPSSTACPMKRRSVAFSPSRHGSPPSRQLSASARRAAASGPTGPRSGTAAAPWSASSPVPCSWGSGSGSGTRMCRDVLEAGWGSCCVRPWGGC